MPDRNKIRGILTCSECLTFHIHFAVVKHVYCNGKTVEKPTIFYAVI